MNSGRSMDTTFATRLLPQTSVSSACRCSLSPISAVLDNAHLWSEFEEMVTEMVITKLGRRLFPALKIKLRGLDPNVKYWVWIDAIPLDSVRYKFVNSRWVAVASAEPHLPTHHVHRERPLVGEELMKETIVFQNLKLTNQRDALQSNQIILNSMHKYLPRVHVTPVGAPECTFTFTFHETAFMAVTAYQNKNIVRLKINNNPYAKGFRDTKDYIKNNNKRAVEDDLELEKKKNKRNDITTWKKPDFYQLPLTNYYNRSCTTPTWTLNTDNLLLPFGYSFSLPICNPWPYHGSFNCASCNLMAR